MATLVAISANDVTMEPMALSSGVWDWRESGVRRFVLFVEFDRNLASFAVKMLSH
jgi:hypothetical protein